MSSSDIYTDVSELGLVKTTIGLVIGVIISIIFISIGVYLSFFDKNNHTAEVSSIVSKVVSCNSSVDKNRVDCDLIIHYDYEGKSYNPELPIHTIDSFHVVGSPITIYVDPLNPSDFSLSSLKQEKIIGWGLNILGIIILLVSLFTWWLSRRYKAYSALQGIGFGLSGLGGNKIW